MICVVKKVILNDDKWLLYGFYLFTYIFNQYFSEKLVVTMISLKEQKAIVYKVNALMGLCDALEKEVKQSQE